MAFLGNIVKDVSHMLDERDPHNMSCQGAWSSCAATVGGKSRTARIRTALVIQMDHVKDKLGNTKIYSEVLKIKCMNFIGCVTYF